MSAPGRGRRIAVAVQACIAALALCGSAVAPAQPYPTKPIRMVIPFAPGGTTDLLARALGQHLGDSWGQQVVPENKPGANGIIAADILAKAPGDPHLLMVVAMGHAVNRHLYKKLPYDTERDFTPVSLLALFPQQVLVHPALPAATLKDLLALAKNGSRPLTYASGGIGSSQHLAGALFAFMAGIKMDHVPYKGGAPGLVDVMAGNVNLMVTQPTSQAFVSSGKLRALAISSPKRALAHPDLPTVSEAGVPGYESQAWYGLVAPKGLAPEVLKKLADETVRAVKTRAVQEILASQGGEAVGGAPAEFAAFIQAEGNRYARVIREAGISAE